jgi:predicted MPP superfamily phosphohydrolase
MFLSTLVALTGFSILSKAYWNTFRPELKEVHIDVDNNKGFNGELKILQLTDIHIEKMSVRPEKVLQMVGDEPVDLIALTGDYLDRVKSIDRFIQFLEVIMLIPNRYGVYAVWGNHDWAIKDKLSILKKEMERVGVVLLENESETIMIEDTPIHLIGIDDHYSGHSDIERAFDGVPQQGVRVVLTHDPLVVKDMDYSFDYLLCGHFHSGQMYYPIPIHSLKMGLKPFRKYLCGLQYHANGTYYISGGLGQTGANLRLGCRPEITIHTLSSVSNKKIAVA